MSWRYRFILKGEHFLYVFPFQFSQISTNLTQRVPDGDNELQQKTIKTIQYKNYKIQKERKDLF